MTEQDLLPYCFFYKGEALMPAKYEQTHAHLLWMAERFVCEDVPHEIDADNPRNDITSYIDSYVGKWSPFEHDDIMATYRKHARTN